eukprot:11512128-Alexandrium_andersonii.AAC.1
MASWLAWYGLACFAKVRACSKPRKQLSAPLSRQRYLSGPVINNCGTRKIPSNRQRYTKARAPN